ncbi:MAG: hypothetical protein JXB35_09030, partial [Anaerolineae bacterium]|nr:hypothetical protein [Anaerolineae bacterium]
MNKLYIRLTLAFLAVIVLTLCSITLALILILRNSPLQERQVETQLVAQAQGIATVFRRTARRQMGTTEGDLLLQETAERQEIRLAWANAEG